MHLNFKNGKTLSVGAEMCKKSTSLFKARDSWAARIGISDVQKYSSIPD